MKRSMSAWLVAVVLVLSLVLVGCPGGTEPEKIGSKEPSAETSTPAGRGAISQVTFERMKSGAAQASELRVGDGMTTVVSCYPDIDGAEDPIAAAAYDFATAPGSLLLPDATSPSGFSTGIKGPLTAPAATYTHLDLISITSTSPTAHVVKFSSAEVPDAQVTISSYATAHVVAGLMQSAGGAAQSKLALSGTEMTLSFQLPGNGPCPPPDATGAPVAPPAP